MYRSSPPSPASRHRRWTRAGRGTVVAALAGILAVSGAVPASAGSTTLPAHNPRSGTTAERSPLTAIPDAAMLQPEDLGGDGLTPTDGDYWAHLQPPQPCKDGPYRSVALQRAERGVQALIGVDGGPEVIMEHVSYYRGNGAHRYLRELRRAVAACPAGDPHAERWAVLATGVAGDESVLLTRRTWIDYAEVYHVTYVVVARVGRALVVLADVGWETSSGAESVVREFIPAAVRRASVLNRR